MRHLNLGPRTFYKQLLMSPLFTCYLKSMRLSYCQYWSQNTNMHTVSFYLWDWELLINWISWLTNNLKDAWQKLSISWKCHEMHESSITWMQIRNIVAFRLSLQTHQVCLRSSSFTWSCLRRNKFQR
jgi:hypothetical protein